MTKTILGKKCAETVTNDYQFVLFRYFQRVLIQMQAVQFVVDIFMAVPPFRLSLFLSDMLFCINLVLDWLSFQKQRHQATFLAICRKISRLERWGTLLLAVHEEGVPRPATQHPLDVCEKCRRPDHTQARQVRGSLGGLKWLT